MWLSSWGYREYLCPELVLVMGKAGRWLKPHSRGGRWGSSTAWSLLLAFIHLARTNFSCCWASEQCATKLPCSDVIVPMGLRKLYVWPMIRLTKASSKNVIAEAGIYCQICSRCSLCHHRAWCQGCGHLAWCCRTVCTHIIRLWSRSIKK